MIPFRMARFRTSESILSKVQPWPFDNGGQWAWAAQVALANAVTFGDPPLADD
jgi:hypothetical protein